MGPASRRRRTDADCQGPSGAVSPRLAPSARPSVRGAQVVAFEGAAATPTLGDPQCAVHESVRRGPLSPDEKCGLSNPRRARGGGSSDTTHASPDHIASKSTTHQGSAKASNRIRSIAAASTRQVNSESRVEVSGQPLPSQTGHDGSGTIAPTGHLFTQRPQSSHVYGSIANRPRYESVLVSAPVGHEKSHAPHPMQTSSRTCRLTASHRVSRAAHHVLWLTRGLGRPKSWGWNSRSSPMQSQWTHGATSTRREAVDQLVSVVTPLPPTVG